jgi:hypothetical protein
LAVVVVAAVRIGAICVWKVNQTAPVPVAEAIV